MAGSAQAGKVGSAGSAAGSSVALEKTEWKLVRLGDVPVKVEGRCTGSLNLFSMRRRIG